LSKADPDPGWAFFDRVYCITLADRLDRRAAATRQFQAVGLLPRVEIFTVAKHPRDTEQGIFESHMSCLRAGLSAGAQTILVFEDDILFERFSPAAMADAVLFLRTDADWHLFFLGCFVKSSRPTARRAVHKVRFKCTTHAYAVHRRFAQTWVQTPWAGVAYDDALRHLRDDHTYALCPGAAFQSESPTDNSKNAGLDRVRRLLGGMPRLQKLNEFTHRHARALVVAHIVALMAIAVVIYLLWR
jgi:GR25 family glycosyltransferase involved in LPS biosynthesis